MKKQNIGGFGSKTLRLGSKQIPLIGQIELTYRCNFNCVHCYCKGSEDKERELTTEEIKGIINQLFDQGCLYLCFTGGEPFIRSDFMDIYSYARKKGFLIAIFTNAALLTRTIITKLEKSPPYLIEVTLNGITEKTYESITQVSGSFRQALKNIEEMVRRNFILIIKTNCMKQNVDEISKIKSFADRLLGKGKERRKFGYDIMIFPRLNGDKSPCQHRLSYQELEKMRKSEPEIWKEYKEKFCSGFDRLSRNRKFLYQCEGGKNNFFITPYGKLRFCQFTAKFEADLKFVSFKDGFYGNFSGVEREEYKTNSKCKKCRYRPVCYHCPARSYLETGSEELPVDYFCHLAKASQMSAN